jgi:hypothetical protein
MAAKVDDEGACRLCGKKNRPWLDAKERRHNTINADHIVERDEGGDDVPENCMPLCGSGTTGCHGGKHSPDPAIRLATRMLMRSRMKMPEEEYIVERKSQFWLDDHFPERSRRR